MLNEFNNNYITVRHRVSLSLLHFIQCFFYQNWLISGQTFYPVEIFYIVYLQLQYIAVIKRSVALFGHKTTNLEQIVKNKPTKYSVVTICENQFARHNSFVITIQKVCVYFSVRCQLPLPAIPSLAEMKKKIVYCVDRK